MKRIVKWAAEGAKERETKYLATRGHASVAGSMLVLRKSARLKAAKQGGTADHVIRP